MKKFLVFGMLLALPMVSLAASVDYFLKIDGIDGESRAASPARVNSNSASSTSGGNVEFEWKVEEGESAPPRDPNPSKVESAEPGSGEAQADVFLKIEGVEGESGKNQAPGVEPDEIDVAAKSESQPLTPDFGLLLGGGDSEDANRARAEVAKILLQGAKEQGAPTEQISLNYEEIKTTSKQKIKLFGFIPVSAQVEVNIDKQQEVKVKFPWWAFLATGKNGDNAAKEVVTSISNVLKTKHEAIKNAIGNIR